MQTHYSLLITLFITSALVACSSQTSNLPGAYSETELTDAAAKIDDAGLMQRVNVLSSDEFEGRAPSTPGGRKTVEYLESAFASLGLTPLFDGAEGPTFRQKVSLIEQTVTNAPDLTIGYIGGDSQSLSYKDNAMLWTTRVADQSSLDASELVFVGYGVVAPEYGWNDYADVDMTGKTALILVNDPGYRAPDSDLFKGKTMTYYGRWTYKFEEAARQGAAGAIVIHETGAAGYPWEVVSGSWSGAQYMLDTEDGNANRVAVEGWITDSAATELLARNGLDYTALVERAGLQGFKPFALETNVSAMLEMTSRQSESYNVGAMIEGTARPDEAFIYTAHWDHLGVKPDAEGDDKIYNGAQDNATGTAGLIELADAFSALDRAPQRSVVFLAVTAEESGLLGSKQYAEDPAIPMNKTVAGINMDAIAAFGETDDLVVIGYGNSEMDNYLKQVAEQQSRVVVPEPTPEKGFFYRSDHFNLAKKGVPMLYAKAGVQVRNQPEGYGAQATADYISNRYHKPADEIHEQWDSGGILQDLEAHFLIGVAISDSQDWPQWSDGNEFKAIRDASLAE